MLLLPVLVCTFFQLSQETPIVSSKPKPVDLSHSCLSIKTEDREKNDVPILLIHGYGGSKENWKGINEVLALKTGRKVCIADMRNHGESPWNDEADSITMAEDVNHLLDRLQISKAVILGHSMGGKIAVDLAVNYPSKVDKLIVEDMRPNGFSPEAGKNMVIGLTFQLKLLEAVNKEVTEEWTKETLLKFVNDLCKKMNISMSFKDPDSLPVKCSEGKCNLHVNPIIARMFLKDPFSIFKNSYGRFDGPALFIYGTESEFKVGEDEKNIKEMFPNTKLISVKGADHMVHDHPEFMDAVIKFINEK